MIGDVTAKFENQSLEELSEQQIKIQEMLDSGKASVDSEFWEAVLKELHVFKARTACRLSCSRPSHSAHHSCCLNTAFSFFFIGTIWLLGQQRSPKIQGSKVRWVISTCIPLPPFPQRKNKTQNKSVVVV